METAVRRLGLSLSLLLSTACAAGTAFGGSSDAAQRARRAAEALERDDFTAARDDLALLAFQCEPGVHGRRALLLLAATALDPANPTFSPREAARASAAYILSPDADQDQLPIARSLYRLAVDLGANGPHVDEDWASAGIGPDSCTEGDAGDPARPLPAMPSTSATAPFRSLQSTAVIPSDSLAAVRAQVETLRSELARITRLLREGLAPAGSGNDGGR
jgi:hypothetical protein